jgi:hypothetical protein
LKHKSSKPLILVIGLLVLGLCLGAGFIFLTSGLTFWAALRGTGSASAAQLQPTRRAYTPAQLPAPPTATPIPTSTPAATPTPPPTETPPPTPTPLPPTETPSPVPTETQPPAPPPTATPLPTDTPAPPPPSYPFTIKETASFPTSHLNFDVYVAITDKKNKPLRDYRVIGTHSSGLQFESQGSAGDWIANSGAMHYKAGNIKVEAPNSPTGLWTLQLVDSDNQPVAPSVEFPFDAANPTWYFLLYVRE